MGLVANLLIGIVGALIGGFIATRLGFEYAGFVGNLVVATLGAILLIVIVRAFRGRR
jgi:uncharacterized membrane protein YeaQ/YmgE (transglycosylase-associated protein family)